MNVGKNAEKSSICKVIVNVFNRNTWGSLIVDGKPPMGEIYVYAF